MVSSQYHNLVISQVPKYLGPVISDILGCLSLQQSFFTVLIGCHRFPFFLPGFDAGTGEARPHSTHSLPKCCTLPLGKRGFWRCTADSTVTAGDLIGISSLFTAQSCDPLRSWEFWRVLLNSCHCWTHVCSFAAHFTPSSNSLTVASCPARCNFILLWNRLFAGHSNLSVSLQLLSVGADKVLCL